MVEFLFYLTPYPARPFMNIWTEIMMSNHAHHPFQGDRSLFPQQAEEFMGDEKDQSGKQPWP